FFVQPLHPHLDVGTPHRRHKIYRYIAHGVLAPGWPALSCAAPPEDVSEQVAKSSKAATTAGVAAEDVLQAAAAPERRAPAATRPGRVRAEVVSQALFPKLVVQSALLLVAEYLVRAVDSFELRLCLGFALVSIGVILAGELLVGPPYLVCRSPLRNTELTVVVRCH